MLLCKPIGVALAGLVALAAAVPRSPLKYTYKSCSLEGTVLPEIEIPGWEQLPRPQTATPLVVTVGRGTQNYTCASAQSAPKLQGAVARLYDTSCLARRRPRTLDALPAKLLAFSPEDLGHSRDGHHFFNAAGTPIFDMSAFGGGVFAGALAASVKGPPTADYYTPSQAYSRRKRGNGDGRPKTLPAINWLRLTPVAGSTEGRFREGFRVVTAGGTAPESCKDQPAHFEVPYATEYWFY